MSTTDEAQAMAAILLAEEARRQAMVKGDTAALDQLLSPDLVHTHTTGRCQTKTEYLDMIRAEPARYERVDAFDRQVIVHGATAWMHGRQLMQTRRNGEVRTLQSRFLAVWTKVGADWKLAAFIATKCPGAPAIGAVL